MLKWLRKKRVVVVRGDRMTDGELLEAVGVDPKAPILLALKECQHRLEEEVLEDAFTGKPEERLRNLARVEGSREVLAIVFGYQEKGLQLLKAQQEEEERKAK